MALTTIPASLSATALTLTTAAQPNITSVGTLTGLTVSGNIAGTLTTAAQTNITSVGTLTGLTSSGTLSVTNQVAIKEIAPGIESGHSSPHSMQVGRWVGSNDRWVIVPEPEGTPLYSRELTYHFTTDTWSVEGGFAATLSTAAQPNITSLGTLTGLTTSGSVGIGVSSIGSSTKLQVAGRGLFTDGLPDPADGSPAGVAIGYNTTSGYGFIQAIQTGVANKDLYLQPSGSNNVIIANSGGSVGIGTSNPTTHLSVTNSGFSNTSTTGIPAIRTEGNYGGAIGLLDTKESGWYAQDSGDTLYQYVGRASGTAANSSIVMTYKSSGNVGIGTSGPVTLKSSTTLQVSGNAKLGDDNARGLLSLGDIASTGANAGIWRGAAGAYAGTGNYLNLGGYDGITFTTGNADISSQTEAMRILANGTFLVGKLADDNSAGFKTNTSSTYMVSSAATPTFINRLSSAGDLIEFRKDSATKGRIGTDGSDIYIGSDDCNLFFFTNAVLPVNSVGGGRDDALNLGANTTRFKNLFLSEGVYLGGAGAANKLDDYEEGAWTPDLRNGTTSLSTQTFDYGPRAIYTKIGRVVYIHFSGRLSSVAGTGSSELRLFGLPFTAANFGGYQEMRLKVIIGNNVTASYAQYGVFAFARSNANDFGFRIMTGGDAVFASNQLQATTFFSVTGFYFTSV